MQAQNTDLKWAGEPHKSFLTVNGAKIVDSQIEGADTATVAAGAALGATSVQPPIDVATNADKLALTGISAGHLVRVTGEANRLEMYMGGAINSDDNWTVIGPNTYVLKAYRQDSGGPHTLTINGVAITSTSESEPTTVGWVREGQYLAMTISGDLLGISIKYLAGGHSWWSANGESSGGLWGGPSGFLAPAGIPARMDTQEVLIEVSLGQ